MMPDINKVINHLKDCYDASRRENMWCFVRKDIVIDILELLKAQVDVEPDYKKYISVEWLKNYYSSIGMDAAHRDVMHIISMWIDAHEMCCCEKKDEAIE
jgi:hypothetical protein